VKPVHSGYDEMVDAKLPGCPRRTAVEYRRDGIEEGAKPEAGYFDNG